MSIPDLNYSWITAEFKRSGHGIITLSTPGITTENTFYGQPTTFKKAMFFKSLK